MNKLSARVDKLERLYRLTEDGLDLEARVTRLEEARDLSNMTDEQLEASVVDRLEGIAAILSRAADRRDVYQAEAEAAQRRPC